jgi:hypothetical protein
MKGKSAGEKVQIIFQAELLDERPEIPPTTMNSNKAENTSERARATTNTVTYVCK